jgi:hypothetical protein
MGYGQDNRPRNQYVQLGKRWSAIVTDIKKGEYSWTEFVAGLTPEELSRGQLMSEDGNFQGRPPSMIPREFYLACQRELKKRFEALFSEQVLAVTRQYLEMAQRGVIKDETRAKMLQYAMERVFGGIPKDINIRAEQPWEQMIVNVTGDDSSEVPDHLKRRYAGYAERQGGGLSEEEEEVS